MLICANCNAIIVISLLLLPVSYAHHLETELPIPEKLRNRVYSGSRDGPMAAWFNRNRSSIKTLVALLDHFKAVENKLNRDLKNQLPFGISPDDTFCNRRSVKAEDAFRTKLRTLGLPPVRKHTCITESNMNLEEELEDKLWSERWDFIRASKMAGRATIAQLGLTNWSDAYPHANFTYVDHIHRCEVLHNVGFRVKGEWGVMLSVTQHPISWLRGDRRREYQTEYLTVEDDKVDNILVSLPSLDKSGTYVNDTTTTRENWSGTPAASIFQEVKPLGENPALSIVLRSKQEWREQVQDSRTPSNIAILILSCLLTLIPISLFTQASTFTLFLYTAITDIISCIPLAIKGIELMKVSSKHSDTVIWAFGPVLPRETTLVVESWSAKCTANNDVRLVGMGLLFIAITLMIVGIVIEVWMIKRLNKRLRREKSLQTLQQIRRYNEHLKHSWFDETLCVVCDCVLDKRNYSSDIDSKIS